MSLKSSISGIRGIVGESLTPSIILEYVSAFSAILPMGSILVGSDTRVSKEMIKSLVIGTLNALGRDVTDIGIVPTPLVLYGVRNNNFAGGIAITASHNPEQWNALKLINSEGKFLSPQQFLKLNKSKDNNNFTYAQYNKLGNIEKDLNTITDKHQQQLNKIINAKSNSIKKVVFDPVNGAGYKTTRLFLEQNGYDVIGINDKPTGIFQRPPEPTPNNLSMLSKAVIDNKCDIGFALDPDADRLVLIDENGNAISEELTLAICVKHYIENYQKSDIVINLSTSRVIEDIANQNNCTVYRVPTGEIHVTEKMEEIDAKIGGEGNGGIIFPLINKCRDALVGVALVLEYLNKTEQRLSDVVTSLPSYTLIKEKIDAKDLDYESCIDKLKFKYKQHKVDNRDGLRVDLPNSWFLIRKSNTEPIIRIFAEAPAQNEAKALISQVKKIILL